MNYAHRTNSLFAALVAVLVLFAAPRTSISQGVAPQDAARTEATQSTYVPIVTSGYPWRPYISAEANAPITPGTRMLTRTLDLGVDRMRLNGRISWRAMQPKEGDPIDWTPAFTLEQELIALNAAGIHPILVVDDHPRWASIDPTNSCTAIRADKFEAFAEYVVALVNRYSAAPYNVKIWELGNEPDVDPYWFGDKKDMVYGCWGNIADPFYGGEHYGEMLKVVTPRIRAADRHAQVWIGGLLLDRENETRPGYGRPELFFKGILEAGAGLYFDAVPYHFYPPYQGKVSIDHSLIGFDATVANTDPNKGGIVGKANFLRGILAEYGLTKPLHLNESALMCVNDTENPPPYCKPTEEAFFIAQAHYAVKAPLRAMNADVESFVWYVIDNGGWRQGGLYDWMGNPRPAYSALRTFSNLTRNTTYLSTASGYPDAVEAFALRRSSNEQVHIVWARTDDIYTINAPTAKLIAAYDIDGNALSPAYQAGGSTYWNIGIDPVYIVRRP